jgi:deoxyribodipyrimidine photo-lyase
MMAEIAALRNEPLQPDGSLPQRRVGLDRLRAFVPWAGRRYAEMRNFDFGPHERKNVSRLSPWIRHRLVVEDEVITAVLATHGCRPAEKFIQEVFWRTYWKGWLELRPGVWQRYRNDVTALVGRLDDDLSLRRRWEEAIAGRTGIACFDAWMQELRGTGYLHNHTRMWFASIWIFTLRLPWQLGADFFLRHLLDGDPASSTMSWRWVAGLQTRGKAYLARAANIEAFSAGRFTDVRDLVPTAEPLVEPPLEPPLPLAPAGSLPAAELFALLLTEDDCEPLSLGLVTAALRAVAAVPTTMGRSPLPAVRLASAFSQGALADTLARVHAVSNCPCTVLADGTAASDIIDWARPAGVRHVITP